MKISLEDFVILKKNLKPNAEVQVLTGSMEPFFYQKDRIKVSPLSSPAAIKVGNPIVFWHNNKLICHFVYKIVNDSENIFITKGINNKEFDPPVRAQQILGIVTEPKIPVWKSFCFKWYVTLYSKLKKN